MSLLNNVLLWKCKKLHGDISGEYDVYEWHLFFGQKLTDRNRKAGRCIIMVYKAVFIFLSCGRSRGTFSFSNTELGVMMTDWLERISHPLYLLDLNPSFYFLCLDEVVANTTPIGIQLSKGQLIIASRRAFRIMIGSYASSNFWNLCVIPWCALFSSGTLGIKTQELMYVEGTKYLDMEKY